VEKPYPISNDVGIASRGSSSTLIDDTRHWQDNILRGALLRIEKQRQVYERIILSNTYNTITFSPLPTGVEVEEGDRWSISMVVRGTPLEKANLQNMAISADKDILSTDLEPLAGASLFRIMVAMSTAGVFSASITKGDNTQVLDFYEGANLQADSLYIFDLLVHPGDSVNFRYSTDAILRILRVQEIMVATQ